MPIRLVCSGCKKTLKVADTLAGKRVKCPGCQTPITIPNSTTTETTPVPAPAAVPTKKPIQDDDLGLAPLDDDPIPKPIPAAKKVAVAPAQPTAKKPTAKKPTAQGAQPAAKPQAPAAKPPTNDLDEFGLAPLGDDLFPAAPVPAKPAATVSKTSSGPKPTAKIPVAKSADEDEEQNFNLQPLADLGSDLLGSADPLGAASPLGGTPLPNPANPYLAPQTSISSAATINGSLPVGKTAKECIRTYSTNFGHGILFGFKSMGVLLGVAAVAYVVFFIFGKVVENMEPTIDNIEMVSYILWGLIWVLGICWFIVQCWLLKGLLYFGYSIAKQDYNAAENALNSPGSLLQFILASVINCVPIFAIYYALYFLVFATHWAVAIPAFLLLSATVNFLGLNLMFFYEYDVNCLTIFRHWNRIVVPHWLQYFLTVFLCTLVGLVIQVILIFGVTMVFGLLKESLQKLSADPRIVALLAGSILYSVIYGIVGAYYAIMQGVCFRKMLRLSRNRDDDEE